MHKRFLIPVLLLAVGAVFGYVAAESKFDPPAVGGDTIAPKVFANRSRRSADMLQ